MKFASSCYGLSTTVSAQFVSHFIFYMFYIVLHAVQPNDATEPPKVVRFFEEQPAGTRVEPFSSLGIWIESTDNVMLSPDELFKVITQEEQSFIATSTVLDREDSTLCKLTSQNNFVCTINLDIMVIKTGDLLPVHHRVEVILEDINDCIPTFSDKIHHISIPENIKPNETAFSIPNAIDQDSQNNAIKEYKLVLDNPRSNGRNGFGSNKIFDLKLSSRSSDEVLFPKLIVVGDLDFETQPSYMLTLTASDRDYSGSMKINISVIDVNDNSPVFDSSQQFLEVFENRTVGDCIMNVSATDIDTGENGRVTYRFAEETVPEILEYFRINSTSGQIFLQKSLKNQGGATLSVQVEARDGGNPPLTDLVTMEFAIRDVNDNKPVIEFNPVRQWVVDNRSIYFSENEEELRVIGFVKVVDDDPGIFGQTALKQVNATEFFQLVSISPEMQALRTMRTFDREERDVYWVQFEASDCAITDRDTAGSPPCTPLKSTETFAFYVGDVNDFKPRFQRYGYNFTIVEESEPRILETIVVEDEDYGSNGTVEFSIHSLQHDEWFFIDKDTGIFKTIKKLDRETLGSKINLTVKVRDLGTPSKINFKTFDISIIDIDDNWPKFNQSSYTFQVMEGLGVGHAVGRVQAVDPDLNSCVVYYASERDVNSEIFEVESKTGVIRTKKDFDFETEKQKEFYFEINAANCEEFNNPSDDLDYSDHTDLVRANIQLIDDNDNSPKILSPLPMQEFSIAWDADTTYEITQINAIDDDFGQNAKLTYHVSDPYNWFGVDPDQGFIYLKERSIYKSRDKRVTIEIRVSDNGQQRNEVKQNNIVFFDANITMFNTSLNFGARYLETAMPKVMIYAVSTIGAIVLLIILIWLVLLLRLRSSRSLNTSIKAHYSAVAGETQLHRHNPHQVHYTINNGTIGRSQSPLGGSLAGSNQGGGCMKNYHVEGSDNHSLGTSSPDDRGGVVYDNKNTLSNPSLQPQLTTFNEYGSQPRPKNGTFDYRNGNGNNSMDPNRGGMNSKNATPILSPHNSHDRGAASMHPSMIYYPQRSCHPALGGVNSGPPQQPFMSPSSFSGGAAPNHNSSSSTPVDMPPIGSISATSPLHGHTLSSPYSTYAKPSYNQNQTNEGLAGYGQQPQRYGPPTHERYLAYDSLSKRNNNPDEDYGTLKTFHPSRSLSDGETALNNMYPGQKSNTLTKPSKKSSFPSPGVNYSENATLQALHQNTAPSNSSEVDDSSPEIPPRPQDPDHPKNVLGPVPSGRQQASHEKWKLPSENSFRAVPNPNGPNNTASRKTKQDSRPPAVVTEAPDLCKDVRSSLEKNKRAAIKNYRQTNEGSRTAQV